MKKYKSIGSHIAKEQLCSTGLPLCVPVVFNMEEIWKDIVGYEGFYQISNLGNVKSLSRINSQTEIILKFGFNGDYNTVVLMKDKKPRTFRIHRLVALHFIPNPQIKPQVNHKDGVKTNNCVYNLEWNTLSENRLHAYRTGLQKPTIGENVKTHKLTEKNVREIRRLKLTGASNVHISEILKINYSTLRDVVNNVSWKHVKI